MIKINSFYSKRELERYYNFVLNNKPSIVKSRGAVVLTLLNRLPQKQSPKIKIESVYELLTMDFAKLKKFYDSLATNRSTYKYLINTRKDDLRIFKNYYSEFFHKIDETNGSRNNMSLVKNLDITVCPYCNRNYINSRKNHIGANFDHYYDKDKYPFFALTLGNLIPCCATCNRIKKMNLINFAHLILKVKMKFYSKFH